MPEFYKCPICYKGHRRYPYHCKRLSEEDEVMHQTMNRYLLASGLQQKEDEEYRKFRGLCYAIMGKDE